MIKSFFGEFFWISNGFHLTINQIEKISDTARRAKNGVNWGTVRRFAKFLAKIISESETFSTYKFWARVPQLDQLLVETGWTTSIQFQRNFSRAKKFLRAE